MSKLVVPMAQISKAVYTKMAKSEYVIAKRPCGFITEITTDSGKTLRRMYVTHDDNYYSGVMLPWESLEDFNTFEFHGVEIEMKAKFQRAMENA
jgi:hypothetical protein